MPVDRADVRDVCTEAVFERGVEYYSEGRIRDCTRIGGTIAATVEGSRAYDLRLSISAEDFDPFCTCPYDGPGECKHVVAVLLSLAEDPPLDQGPRIDEALASADDEDLRQFLRDELARDTAMLDRFLAGFGAGRGKSPEAYRAAVDRLFDEHTQRYSVVVDPIDFSELTELGERYRERGRYRRAADVYRGLVAGIDDNIELVDGAYDHYASAFRDGLDAYVECVSAATLDPAERDSHVDFLSERARTSVPRHQEEFRRALDELDATGD